MVRLQGKILQVREIDAPRTVGYGATHRAAGPTRVATVAVGSWGARNAALLAAEILALKDEDVRQAYEDYRRGLAAG